MSLITVFFQINSPLIVWYINCALSLLSFPNERIVIGPATSMQSVNNTVNSLLFINIQFFVFIFHIQETFPVSRKALYNPYHQNSCGMIRSMPEGRPSLIQQALNDPPSDY